MLVRDRGICRQWYRLGPEQANTKANIHPSRVHPHSRFILMISLRSCRGGSAKMIQVGSGYSKTNASKPGTKKNNTGTQAQPPPSHIQGIAPRSSLRRQSSTLKLHCRTATPARPTSSPGCHAHNAGTWRAVQECSPSRTDQSRSRGQESYRTGVQRPDQCSQDSMKRSALCKVWESMSTTFCCSGVGSRKSENIMSRSVLTG